MRETKLNFLRLLTVCVLSLASFVGCPGTDGNTDAGTDSGEPEPLVWESAFDTSEAGSLSTVWGTSPSDVFIAGGDDEGGTMFHFDGTSWTQMVLPADVPLLVWLYGFGSDDVFAVGVSGAMVHYNGTEWSRIVTDTETDLWGVFGFSRDEIWIVGGAIDSGTPVLMKYNASDATFQTEELSQDQNPNGAYALFKVWGLGDHLFAVGQRGLILQYEEGTWMNRSAGSLASEDFVSLWGNAENNIVAVGGRANARIATWDGTEWDTIAPSGFGGLNGVFMSEEGIVDVGGVNGYMGLFDTDNLQLVDSDSGTRHCIHAIWGDNAGVTYAVGGSFIPGNHVGVALVKKAE
jgi:hypothetical protein